MEYFKQLLHENYDTRILAYYKKKHEIEALFQYNTYSPQNIEKRNNYLWLFDVFISNSPKATIKE